MTEQIEQAIKDNGVRLIRAVYAGPEGIVRGKAFTPRCLQEVLQGGIGLTQAQASVFVLDQLPVESEFQPVGEVRICPDPDTFQLLPYLPGHARMLSDLRALDGNAWELCPRALLKQAMQLLKDRGWSIEAAFENEFTLYEQELSEWRPVDSLNCFSSSAMDIASPYILPLIESLETQGIEVEKYFPEAGAGQQEVPVRHRPGLQAADQQVVFRETVNGVAHANGYRASFMPKVDANSAGNGCHIHFSLQDNTGNVFFDHEQAYGLSLVGQRFAAGVLSHLPALLALTAPTVNSYRRFVERCWSSCYTCWGPDNREAAIRVASGFAGREATTLNLEYRPADPTCNPYLALAGIVFAGLHGIDAEMSLGDPLLTDPALLGAEERARRGIAPYPSSLRNALSELEKDTYLTEALGARRMTDYLIMKRAECDAIESMGDGAESLAYQFRF